MSTRKRKADVLADIEEKKKNFRHEYDHERLRSRCDYTFLMRLGGGSFGELYMGRSPRGERVAMKVERHDHNCKYSSPQLRHEYKVYRELVGCKGFANIYYYGSLEDSNVMVMDLLHMSLEDRFHKSDKQFSLRTILHIADQMIERAETLHSRHLIHRDIKVRLSSNDIISASASAFPPSFFTSTNFPFPSFFSPQPANFMLGPQFGPHADILYGIDFGLSKRYRDPVTEKHILHRKGRSLTGTPRYASINNHLGVEQSRRDDLESIAYVLIYLIRGSLPWQGMHADTPQKKYRMILKKKQDTTVEELCRDMPVEFGEMLEYARGMRFDEEPDYKMLRKKFKNLYNARGFGAPAAAAAGGGYYSSTYWDWGSGH